MYVHVTSVNIIWYTWLSKRRHFCKLDIKLVTFQFGWAQLAEFHYVCL